MPRRRLGAFLPVPQPVAAEIDALRFACGDEGLSLIAPHVTLMAPTNVPNDEVDDVIDFVRTVANKHQPMRLHLGPTATFLPVNPVLYLQVTSEAPLEEIATQLLDAPHFRPSEHPFVPHVTLNIDNDIERIQAGVTALASFERDIYVDRIDIVEFDSETRKWSVIADAPLAEPSVVGRGGRELVFTAHATSDSEVDEFLAKQWERIDEERGVAWGTDIPLVVRAEHDGVLVGVASGHLTGEASHLTHLVVREGERGTGIGGQLLAQFEHEAREAGAKYMTLTTDEDSPQERFYANHGWERTIRLPEWRPGFALVRMRRSL